MCDVDPCGLASVDENRHRTAARRQGARNWRHPWRLVAPFGTRDEHEVLVVGLERYRVIGHLVAIDRELVHHHADKWERVRPDRACSAHQVHHSFVGAAVHDCRARPLDHWCEGGFEQGTETRAFVRHPASAPDHDEHGARRQPEQFGDLVDLPEPRRPDGVSDPAVTEIEWEGLHSADPYAERVHRQPRQRSCRKSARSSGVSMRVASRSAVSRTSLVEPQKSHLQTRDPLVPVAITLGPIGREGHGDDRPSRSADRDGLSALVELAGHAPFHRIRRR